ncbi:MAG: GspE/PulE family protein [Gallionellaceae bacterium]|nr:GspE/PulE family protein [Gallionellaceae bacterium]
MSMEPSVTEISSTSLLTPAPDALALIPGEIARRHLLLPLSLDSAKKQLTLAIADPHDVVALDRIRILLRNEYTLVAQTASATDIERALDRYYGSSLAIDGLLQEIAPIAAEPRAPQEMDSAHPVAKLVEMLIAEAVRHEASDIHFEPEHDMLRIRLRVDGVLRQAHSLRRELWSTLTVRLKVMSGMDIAETRAPQDGHISLDFDGRAMNFRVATHPTTHGENMVLRILDRQKGIVPLDSLGLQDDELELLTRMIARPEGIVLATGPTGSGKTTTLYSILNRLNVESVNIMTLEDPVEYVIPLIRQTSVNEAARMDFSDGVRSILRQDPDIILVGEIRDRATAEMAFRAAMTGHQVYSTLHANSALSAIPRLLDMGILPDVMAGNIIGVIAQRLVRALCPHCKKPYAADAHERKMLGAAEPSSANEKDITSDDENVTLYRATGCAHCHDSGYKGRLAVMELLRMDDDLDDLIARRAGIRELRQSALAHGVCPIARSAMRLARQGRTTLAEIARVVDVTHQMD